MRLKSETTQITRIRSLERTVRELTREQADDKRGMRKLLLRNFLIGVARGIGSVIGIALLGMVSVFLLSRLSQSNMEGLGTFIAEIVKWVQRKL